MEYILADVIPDEWHHPHIIDAFDIAKALGVILEVFQAQNQMKNDQGLFLHTLLARSNSEELLQQFVEHPVNANGRSGLMNWRPLQNAESELHKSDQPMFAGNDVAPHAIYNNHFLATARYNQNIQWHRQASLLTELNMPPHIELYLYQYGVRTVGDLYSFFIEHRQPPDSTFSRENIDYYIYQEGFLPTHGISIIPYTEGFMDDRRNQPALEHLNTPIPEGAPYGRYMSLHEINRVVQTLTIYQNDIYIYENYAEVRLWQDRYWARIRTFDFVGMDVPQAYGIFGNIRVARLLVQGLANKYGSFILDSNLSTEFITPISLPSMSDT